jgi:hypothetical protein
MLRFISTFKKIFYFRSANDVDVICVVVVVVFVVVVVVVVYLLAI